MKKAILPALVCAALLTGCGTVSTSTDETTAPTTAVPEIPVIQESAAVPAAPVVSEEEEVIPEAPPAPDVPAIPAEDDLNAEYLWLDTGVYEMYENGSHVDKFFVFDDPYNGRFLTRDSGVGFTCEQSKIAITFHMGGVDDTTVYVMGEPDANGNPTADMGSVQYTFVYLPDEDPSTFDPANLIGKGDLIVD
ncbi:MAG: hypothetical protein K6F80_06935 [Oscillospiraceae bacterium]|nr:hypothetical protein [Oscillospiraceae bacterium]